MEQNGCFAECSESILEETAEKAEIDSVAGEKGEKREIGY